MKPLLIYPLLATLLLPACKKSGGDASTDPAPESPALTAILLKDAPPNPLTITEARRNPTPGTEVVISGKVMGKKLPFVNGFALVTLGDPDKLTSCDLQPGDDCPTPWDVCCDLDDDITAGIATIQIVDDKGRPLKQGLKGLGGMKELSSLVVKGVVAEGSNPDNFLVNATGIHVAMVEAAK